MKLNGSMLVVVAMLVGSFGAMGCKPGDASALPESDVQEQPATDTAKTETSSVTNESATILAKASVAIGQQAPARQYVPLAPPTSRYENRGRAPSARHFWAKGHWQPVNGRYVWVNGRWDTNRAGHRYVQPRHQRDGARWVYVPGHWVRTRR